MHSGGVLDIFFVFTNVTKKETKYPSKAQNNLCLYAIMNITKSEYYNNSFLKKIQAFFAGGYKIFAQKILEISNNVVNNVVIYLFSPDIVSFRKLQSQNCILADFCEIICKIFVYFAD